MHWQFGEMEFGEMKRNTSNWSNFGMLLRRAGLTASAGLSCRKLNPNQISVLPTYLLYTQQPTAVNYIECRIQPSSVPERVISPASWSGCVCV